MHRNCLNDCFGRSAVPPRDPRRRIRLATVALALSLPVAQTVQAAGVYYARAIGEEYLLPPPRPGAAAPVETTPATIAPTEPTREEFGNAQARAIGHEYLLFESPQKTGTPPTTNASPELPGLGARPGEIDPAPARTGFWSRLLIGVAVVGAIVALGGKGGGSAAASIGGDGASGSAGGDAGGSAPPVAGGGGGGDSGGDDGDDKNGKGKGKGKDKD